MFRFRRAINLFNRKDGFITNLKNKLLKDDEDEKQIIPHQTIKQPLNVKQEIEQFITQQTEISDLERIRMKNLDVKLGTNTYFHEIQSYEERLDSDNVMRRQVLARRELQKEKDLAVAHLFNPDPQQKVKTPWIRNINDFTSEAIKQIPYPQHPKLFLEGDFFRYFEDKHYEVDKVAQFDFSESLYTQLVQIQTLRREETVKHRYLELLDNYQNIPIVFNDYTYFSKDSKEGHPIYNIYKRKNENKELIKDDDELVFSGKIIADLIPKHYEDLILDIEEEKFQSLYKEFLPNKSHDTYGCVIEQLGLNFLIVRSNKIQLVLENVDNTFTFIENYLYYIEKSDINLQKYVLKLNLQNFEERTIVYQISHGENVKIRNFGIGQAAIEIYMANENKFIDLNGKDIVNYKKGYKFNIDQNIVNTFVSSASLEEQPKELRTADGHLVYECKQGSIRSFCANDHFLAILERDLQSQISDRLIIMKEKKNHEMVIQESQYSINLESNQIKESNCLYFHLICPYKPFQILKYNIDIKAISLHFSEQLPGFDYNKLQVDTFKITQEFNVCVSFLQDLPVQFVLIQLIDQEQYQSLSQEDVVLYENGCAICQIIVNPSCQQQILDNLQKVFQEVSVLSDKVILKTKGALSGLIGSYTHFFVQQFYGFLCHNGLFDNQKNMIDLPISSYDITKVPSLRNTFISYTLNDELTYQSQKMVALLRENKDNEVDLKKQFGVVLQQCESDIDEAIFRLTFLMSIL
ncbi:unnamed protein product [Paramecium pentaurelia]|uniref:Uncharacterized protein n=1 Tax=Paramecium pentaurelia TaxID=43138 RepID=A0A8S1UUU2_9CILI|nr:unnamed protein product [Paramecium pentaurelia]